MAIKTKKLVNNLTLIILILLKTLDLSKGYLYPSRISSGIYEQDLSSSSIFYDSFKSIIFEYKVPSWKTIDITLRDWRSICETDNFSPSYTCPVFFYLERFIERLQRELVNQSTIAGFGTSPSKIPYIPERCTKIQKHFPTMLTSKASLENYLITMTTACQLKGNVVKRAIDDYIYNIKLIYSSMVRKFEAEFSTKTTGDRVGPAYYVNQITSAQGLMLFNYFFEMNRWDSAVKSCSIRLIPTSILKSSNLTEALNKIESEARKQNYSLSIPLNDPSSYLIAPLADCTFTALPVDSFVVRVLVPVLKNSLKPKLIKLTSIPFFLDNKGETGPLICQIFSDLSGTYVYDEARNFLIASNCDPQLDKNLCQIPTSSSMTLPNLCASAYFSRSFLKIKKYCNLVCEKQIDNLVPLPIFSQVSSDRYIVTGNSDIQVLVKCQGKQDQHVNPDVVGSIEIILACQCSLHFNSQIFSPRQPCGNDLIISHITPVQFLNQDYLMSYDPLTMNFTGVLNKSMMDSKYFDTNKIQRLAGQVDIQSGILVDQIDLDTGDDASAQSSSVEQNGSVTSLWIFVVCQTIGFTCFVIFVLVKFGFFSSYNRFDSKNPQALSYSTREPNPQLSASTQNIIDGSRAQDDHYCHL